MKIEMDELFSVRCVILAGDSYGGAGSSIVHVISQAAFRLVAGMVAVLDRVVIKQYCLWLSWISLYRASYIHQNGTGGQVE